MKFRSKFTKTYRIPRGVYIKAKEFIDKEARDETIPSPLH